MIAFFLRQGARAAALLLLAGAAAPVAAASASVAVAANFAAPMAALAAGFERASGHRLTVSVGSSGKLSTQIIHGAPFDVFFSADQARVQALIAADLALPDSRFCYARGALVLWSPDPGLVDGEGQIVRRGGFRKLALANPRLAPYGAAAAAVISALGAEAALAGKLVYGENIAQVYQFVSSGNAELGFVAAAQLVAAGPRARGSQWRVPATLHPPIVQDAVLLRRGADNPAARALLAYVRQPEGRGLIAAFGYLPGDPLP